MVMSTDPHPSPHRSRPELTDAVFVSLFSGAGGLDLGLESAGWRSLAQIEMDHDCARTLESHNAVRAEPVPVFQRRAEEVDPQMLRRQLELEAGQLPLLAGGPPCQPFTTSGLRRGLSDRRAASAFPAYLAYVDEFEPKALLIENVDGMLSAALSHRPLAERGTDHPPLELCERKGSFLRWLIHQLAARGYSISWGVAEAADYGVPQLRQRAVLIGVRTVDPCHLPEPAHGRDGLPPYRTVREALAGIGEIGPVQPLSERKKRVYELVPPGGNWRDLPAEVQQATMGAAFYAEGGKSGWWRRLAWDSPSPTILGMPDHSSTALVHPTETRCLSVNECAALQSFPLSATFAGSARSQYQQIGNAVPPLLGAALGRQLLSHLAGLPTRQPSIPSWRQTSANRRIGTHGWAQPKADGEPAVTLNGAVRPDHVWHHVSDDVSDVAARQRTDRRHNPPSQRRLFT